MTTLRLASLVALCALSACSVLIDVDEDRLTPRTPADVPVVTDLTTPDVPVGDDRVTPPDVPAPDVADVPPPDDRTTPPDVPVTPDVTDVPVVPDVPTTRCPMGCNDMVDCTVDSCDEAMGRCVFRPDSTMCGARGVCDPERRGCVTLDCTSDTQCQNETLCDGRETCDAGHCVAGTAMNCDDGVSCTADSCNAATGACTNTAMNTRCDDGRFCNGAETCNAMTGCQSGAAPNCDDGIPCTMDSCGESGRACLHMPNAAACPARGPCVTATCTTTTGCAYTAIPRYCEGYCVTGGTCDTSTGTCSGGGAPRDCSDMNPCTADTCDPTAMMCRSAMIDADRDGAPAAMVGSAMCAGGTDCNDSNPMIRPGAAEVCDMVDNNCNGMTDEGSVCGVAGDTCARAIPLDMTGRTTTTILGTTVGAMPDQTDPCGGRMGDVFYAITYPASANLTVEAVPTDPSADPVLSLRTACGNDIFVCNDDAAFATGNTARIWVRPTAATGNNTLYAMVKMADRNGPFRLNVAVTNPGTPPGVCASSSLFDVSAGGALFGVFGSGTSQHQSSACATANASRTTTEDVVAYNTAMRRRVTTTLYTNAPVLYTRGGRCTGTGSTEFRCSSGVGNTQVVTDFPGGSGWIFSDSGTTTNRTYILVVYPEGP